MVVGWILVTHDGNGGLRSCDHRHGVSVKNGVKRGSEAECYLKMFLTKGFDSNCGYGVFSVGDASYPSLIERYAFVRGVV